MFIQLIAIVWGIFFGTINVPVTQSVSHYDCDECWVAYGTAASPEEAAIIGAALLEFDAIYASINLETKIITRKCGRYDAAPKRQIIIKRDGKFVGGKVIGYATAYTFLEESFNAVRVL